MCTPSIPVSGSVSRVVPCGQMTWTSQPAWRRVVHSCHTRRSKGTERFSTRTSARRRSFVGGVWCRRGMPRRGVLPSKAHVSRFGPARLGVGEADEVDEYPVAAVWQRVEHGGVGAADQAHLGVR